MASVPRHRTPEFLHRRLAENVRRLREQAALSQEEVADRSGLHRTYVGAIERAERNASLATVEALVAGLGVDPTELLALGE